VFNEECLPAGGTETQFPIVRSMNSALKVSSVPTDIGYVLAKLRCSRLIRPAPNELAVGVRHV
jgi:hypothetical protein